jgi:hypothetical protein
MRKSNWTPSIVPRDDGQDVYLVMDAMGGIYGNSKDKAAADFELATLASWL